MKQVNLSMYVQIAYMVGMGLSLALIPNILLPIFGFDEPKEVWVRLLGCLVAGLALYYSVCVKHDFLPFYRISVWGRYAFCTFLIIITALKFIQPMLYFFAALETSLAIWTHIALKKIKEI